jgi:hypothetical protein
MTVTRLYAIAFSLPVPSPRQVFRVTIALITHSDTPQSLGLLWTRDRFVAETT